MTVHTFSSREFTRDVGAAKRAAASGPVFITDRGKPRYVLQTIEAYYAQKAEGGQSLLALMDAIPGGEGVDFEVPRVPVAVRPVDFDAAQ